MSNNGTLNLYAIDVNNGDVLRIIDVTEYGLYNGRYDPIKRKENSENFLNHDNNK